MIKWDQASTKRGAVWAFFSVISVIGYFLDKDVQPIIALAMAVSGGLGMVTDDKVEK